MISIEWREIYSSCPPAFPIDSKAQVYTGSPAKLTVSVMMQVLNRRIHTEWNHLYLSPEVNGGELQYSSSTFYGLCWVFYTACHFWFTFMASVIGRIWANGMLMWRTFKSNYSSYYLFFAWAVQAHFLTKNVSAVSMWVAAFQVCTLQVTAKRQPLYCSLSLE